MTRLLPYSHLGRIREEGREHLENSYDESQVMKVGMPRGSVLIFTGGLVHGGGKNTTDVRWKSVLTDYQLGWLRPENTFHAYKPLHDALLAGQFGDEMAKLHNKRRFSLLRASRGFWGATSDRQPACRQFAGQLAGDSDSDSDSDAFWLISQPLARNLPSFRHAAWTCRRAAGRLPISCVDQIGRRRPASKVG